MVRSFEFKEISVKMISKNLIVGCFLSNIHDN